jgi:hypothetical protein
MGVIHIKGYKSINAWKINLGINTEYPHHDGNLGIMAGMDLIS